MVDVELLVGSLVVLGDKSKVEGIPYMLVELLVFNAAVRPSRLNNILFNQ